MEHITITDLGNGYKRLNPEKGYMLKYNGNLYTEAIVKDTTGWSAIIK